MIIPVKDIEIFYLYMIFFLHDYILFYLILYFSNLKEISLDVMLIIKIITVSMIAAA